jgi:hypothetical protein
MIFDTLSSADDWLDAMIDEYSEEYDDVKTKITGGGGAYTAEVKFFGSTKDGYTKPVSKSDREPDLFEPS